MATYLLATDGSEPARQAEEFIKSTATPGQDRVLILGVLDPSVVMGGYQFTSGGGTEILDTERLLNEISLTVEDCVSTASDRLQEIGFEVITEIERGTPGKVICEMAEEKDVHAIVMGRRGAGALAEFLLGSVSSYVVHHAVKPVILIPKPE